MGLSQDVIKSLVVTQGESAIDVPWPLSQSLTEEDMNELRRITRDPSHPWMVEHRQGLSRLPPSHRPHQKKEQRSVLGFLKSASLFLLLFGLLTVLMAVTF